MKTINKNTEKNLKILLVIINILLIIFNVFFLFSHIGNNNKPTHSKYNNISFTQKQRDAKILEIESYLDSISPSYITNVQALAKANDLPSWGCGPSSYALAKILNKKFFDNELTISASYNNNIDNDYQIIERFSLAQKGEAIGDHAWLEIYMGDKFIFIDPTIGQFGKINKIAYQVFDTGNPDISDLLRKEYGIDDIRLSLLIPKVINRVPASADPYPGITIDKNYISYFLQVMDNRNQVNEGIMPQEWKVWVDALYNKYI